MPDILFARFCAPIRSDPHLVATVTTEVQMPAAIPVKWRHLDFANMPAMWTCLADRSIGFRTGGFLIVHGIEGTISGSSGSEKARPVVSVALS
jgi:hypothetical protein